MNTIHSSINNEGRSHKTASHKGARRDSRDIHQYLGLHDVLLLEKRAKDARSLGSNVARERERFLAASRIPH